MNWLVGILLAVGPSEAPSPALTPHEADARRIQRHLSEVEARLRVADTSSLTPLQREARRLAIERLRDYWTAGVFPHNTGHADKFHPYFIDDGGRACAVGDLMIESGHDELARTVSRTENYDYVTDIETDGVLQWAHDNGLAVHELVLIQPGYCICDGDYDPVCGQDGLTYWNECAAEQCAGEEIAHAGECESAKKQCVTQAVSSCGGGISYSVCDPENTRKADPVSVEEATQAKEDETCIDARGCNCTTSPAPGPWTALWALGLSAVWRRRRR